MFQLGAKKKISPKRTKAIVISDESSESETEGYSSGHVSGQPKKAVGESGVDHVDDTNYDNVHIVPVSEALPDIQTPKSKREQKSPDQRKKSKRDTSRHRFQRKIEKVYILNSKFVFKENLNIK